MEFTDFASLAGFVAFNLLSSFLLSYITAPNIKPWYNKLKQPWFRPPNWIFGPVWGILYAMIGVSAWRVYIIHQLVGVQLTAYVIQLGLNFGWTLIFFGGKEIFMALCEMVLLWISIVWNLVVFKEVDEAAGYLLVPYLLWTSFAFILNGSIWWLNPAKVEDEKKE